MHVFNGCHVVADLAEEGEVGLLVSFESGRDIASSSDARKIEAKKCVSDCDGILLGLWRVF